MCYVDCKWAGKNLGVKIIVKAIVLNIGRYEWYANLYIVLDGLSIR